MDQSQGVNVGDYRRITLPFGSLTSADGTPVARVRFCDSYHPALRIDGAPVALLGIAVKRHALPAVTTAEALDQVHRHLSPKLTRDAAIRLTMDDTHHRVTKHARLRAGLSRR